MANDFNKAVCTESEDESVTMAADGVPTLASGLVTRIWSRML